MNLPYLLTRKPRSMPFGSLSRATLDEARSLLGRSKGSFIQGWLQGVLGSHNLNFLGGVIWGIIKGTTKGGS